MKTTIILLIVLLCACANPKDIELNGKTRTFEPYGWNDCDELKNDSIIYKPCVGNIVWDIIGSETLFIPIWLTGWQFYEPIKVKTEFITKKS